MIRQPLILIFQPHFFSVLRIPQKYPSEVPDEMFLVIFHYRS